MKVIIAGAGAMGCRFGSSLFNENEVILVDNWKEHVDKINRTGLSITDDKGTALIPISAKLPENCNEKADLLIIFSKSMQTDSIIQSCLQMITSETKILTLQNGIGNVETLTKWVPVEQLFAGITTYAANLNGPGTVEATGSGIIEIMHITGKRRREAELLIQLFNKSGLKAELSGNVIQSIWEKAAFNAVLNPLCTLTSSTVGQIGAYGIIGDVIRSVLGEIELVAEAEGVDFDKLQVMNVIENVFNPNMSSHHYSSMYHDLQNGRETEIEYLNGAFIKKANQYNIPTPYNTLLYHLIKIAEGNRKIVHEFS
ncbi:2-dehydropantoate 2-reductase [Sporosarcina sp. FSL W7-1349]|uniref:ketopantoate reductase family protein n=1 Tax=Sporosarcina sp. FSL W7-1349 TaxID=2921561 RepID=UPI0030F4CB8B